MNMTIVTSVYDNPCFLKEWIDSVRWQGFRNILVGVDGEECDIEAIKKSCQGAAKILVSKKHVGIPTMFNSLFSIVDDEYVYKLDCDDVARENLLIETTKAIQHNNKPSVVLTKCRNFGAPGVVYGNYENQERWPSAGAYLKRDFIDFGGFNVLLPTLSDTDYFYRLLTCNKKIVKGNEVLVDRRLHGDNFSEVSESREMEQEFLNNVFTKYTSGNARIPLITTNLTKA